MKKGLIVMMIVLMTMALITSCNSEAASTTDSLVEVKIAGGADSKSLNVGSTSNLPDISTLKWFYQARKTSGVFINGQTDGFVAVPGVATGLEGASLGQFSTGGWEFQFKGVVNDAQAGTENETTMFTSSVITKEVSSSTAVNGTVYLTVPLTANATNAKVTFSDLTWKKPASDELADVLASNFTLTITESDPSNTSTWTGSNYSEGVVTFTLTDGSGSFSYDVAGAHTYTFTVEYSEELVAEYVHNVDVALGSDYSVTGSIDVSSNIKYSVVVNDVPVSVNDSSATVQGSATTTTFTVNQTPASVTAGTMSNTTIEFTNGNEAVINSSDSYYIAQATYGAEEAANFVITAGENSSNAVAGIDLDLYKVVEQGDDEKQAVTNQSIKVTTTIAKGLENVSVTNDGSTEGITVNNYDPDSGVLIFTTTHFSKFLVTSSNGAINVTQNKGYTTLSDALTDSDVLADNDTVMLLKNVGSSTSTTSYSINKSITLDGNGYKITGKGNTIKSYKSSYWGGDSPRSLFNLEGGSSENKISVVFKNLDIDNVTYGSTYRAIMMYDNMNSLTLDKVNIHSGIAFRLESIEQRDDKVQITVSDSKLETGDYGYTVYICAPVDMTINDSEIIGWAGLYFKGERHDSGNTAKIWSGSHGSVVAVNNSAIKGLSVASGVSNGFSAICFEDGNVTLSLNDCSLLATSVEPSPLYQTILLNNSWREECSPETKGNKIIITGNSTTSSGILWLDEAPLYEGDKVYVKDDVNLSNLQLISGVQQFSSSATSVDGLEGSYYTLQDNTVAYVSDKAILKNASEYVVTPYASMELAKNAVTSGYYVISYVDPGEEGWTSVSGYSWGSNNNYTFTKNYWYKQF